MFYIKSITPVYRTAAPPSGTLPQQLGIAPGGIGITRIRRLDWRVGACPVLLVEREIPSCHVTFVPADTVPIFIICLDFSVCKNSDYIEVSTV